MAWEYLGTKDFGWMAGVKCYWVDAENRQFADVREDNLERVGVDPKNIGSEPPEAAIISPIPEEFSDVPSWWQSIKGIR